jgi:hypothetical protein
MSPDTIRAVLNACARRLDGRPAAAATTRRKCAVLASALGYAAERRRQSRLRLFLGLVSGSALIL